ncbi:unnamed protein product [Staurois parvus]|uniref:Uncharacterized protein n=1 Tax=Staurois parvus TaxID=386267 RepID=A0ABN9BU97_9NEOB|nr:unnamed protein product [Staurois parvus]
MGPLCPCPNSKKPMKKDPLRVETSSFSPLPTEFKRLLQVSRSRGGIREPGAD